MIKHFLACAVSLSVASPAIAGDRPGKKAPTPAMVGQTITEGSQQRADHLSFAPNAQRFALPLDMRKLDRRPLPGTLVASVSKAADARFKAMAEADEPVTAGDGGRYAVSDTLSNYRKPRFRRSALGTVLTLRLDGETESPPFSVGGGGVAAVLWQALPKS